MQRTRDLNAALVAVAEVPRELPEVSRLKPDVPQYLGGPVADRALLPPDARDPEDRAEQSGAHPRVLTDHHVLQRGHRWNKRMFWNVRAIPCAVILSGRALVMSRPANQIRPRVGLYRPVSI